MNYELRIMNLIKRLAISENSQFSIINYQLSIINFSNAPPKGETEGGSFKRSHAQHVHFLLCEEAPVATTNVLLGKTGK